MCLSRKLRSQTLLFQVPLLSDPDGQGFIFDTLSKKTLLQRLFCLMTGSVVTSSQAPKKGKKAAKAGAKPAGKSKSKAKAAAKPFLAETEVQLAPEQGVQSNFVDVEKGVRQKLWIDDCFKAVNHVVKAVTSIPVLKGREDVDRIRLKHELIRLSLQFAFRGEVLLCSLKGTGKLQKKWSALRPALQRFATEFLLQAGRPVCLLAHLCARASRAKPLSDTTLSPTLVL